ncbi:hypothetical protein SAMN05421771_2548 [Granulicella pectinivorans]|uniref:Uncharacterized protein n=1 Tax=Granulicella pectinivorans TaxID=474950 RepID=A0A1I6MFX2_9BACT|nr:hypothetical protein [Granulicella pectinivorans]SFS14508.1 hypothetical protein SAMN05421771_2548 [Granulicella pectinivorans]
MKALALALLCGLGAGLAQEPARVTFQLERAGLDVPRYTISLDEQGNATYHAELAAPKSQPTTLPGEPAEPSAPSPAIDRKIVLSAATTASIFAQARGLDRFHTACESRAKNVADMGKKTLTYAGPDGSGSCTYNYSDLRQLTELTDTFQAVQATLEMGRQMDFKHRFDRLGLDAVMISLSNMLDTHQATEVGTIAPTLRAIASDTELMQRVRLRAAKMLEQAAASR